MIEDKVLALLRELKPYEKIKEDTELIKSGILDSLAIFSLVTELEDEFKIEIDEDEITAANFSTPLHIETLITNSNKV